MTKIDPAIQQLLAKLAADDDKACWKGYTQVGMKMKGGREVPNCVPAKDVPKQKPEKESSIRNALLGALAGTGIGYGGGRLLGGIPLGPDDKGEWNSQRSLASGLVGLPVGAGLGALIGSLKKDEEEDAEKESASQDSSNFGTESIVDAPIKCTPGFGCKRYFTPQEQEEIDLAKAQIFPTLFPTSGDPVSSQMSSPAWSGIGHGALGALLGAAAGGGVGKLTGANLPLSLALGGLVGGLGGGLYGYGTKAHQNKELENLIQEMPVGADIGDIDLFNDPRLKAQMARDFQRQLVRKGLMG